VASKSSIVKNQTTLQKHFKQLPFSAGSLGLEEDFRMQAELINRVDEVINTSLVKSATLQQIFKSLLAVDSKVLMIDLEAL
jgi:hypothetical protein